MSGTEKTAAWTAFLQIIGMAAAVAAMAWVAWHLVDSANAIAIMSGALAVVYAVGSYVVIHRGGFRKGVAAQFAMLSIAALLSMWLLGAVVALALWGGPVGPSN